MIRYCKYKHSSYFNENLVDWHLGGPKKNGWTRTGPSFNHPPLYDVFPYKKSLLSVDSILSKNRDEINKWHLSFLNGYPQGYFVEYLYTRYDYVDGDMRAKTFLDLLEDMRENGYDSNFPAWVADLEDFDFDFRYFRFDGCHRACCAKHLGIEKIPVWIFKVALAKN